MDYKITCWNCTAEFNLMEAAFCSHPNPTKICPFCLSCYCNAPEDHKEKINKNAPQELIEEKKTAEQLTAQKLGDILIKAGRITPEQLDEAIKKQEFMKKKLGEILVMMGFITDGELELFLLGQNWIDTVDLKNHKLDYELIDRIGADFCLRYEMIPLEMFEVDGERVLRTVLYDMDLLITIKNTEELKTCRIIPYRADKMDAARVLFKIKKYYDANNTLILS